MKYAVFILTFFACFYLEYVTGRDEVCDHVSWCMMLFEVIFIVPTGEGFMQPGVHITTEYKGKHHQQHQQ